MPRIAVTFYGSRTRVELEAAEAIAAVKAGLAWPDGGYCPEIATVEASERAVQPRPKPAGKKRKPKGY